MTNKTWKLKEKMPEDFINLLPDFPRPILQLLWNRNLKKREDIFKFLNPSIYSLYHPSLMLNMKEGAEKILGYIKNNQKIAIYGDYDTDGVCSTVILAKTFKLLEFHNFDVYIPNRYKGGYGLTTENVQKIAERGNKLIITIDCGITDVEEIDLAKKLGMDVIVCDHHLPQPQLPKALIIDPCQPEDGYPFKDLVATALSYKLSMLILELEKHPLRSLLARQFLDLVAIATVADVAPLVDENRIFVAEGLRQLVKTQNIGLRKLLEICGLNLKTKLDPYHVGFIIAPRLNAVGRVKHIVDHIGLEETDYSFELLMTENENEAQIFAQKVNDLNLERQNQVQEAYEEALEQLKKEEKLDKILLLGSEKWSKGIVGIVAGKIKDEFYRPVFIYSKGPEISIGSARSINGYNLVELMSRHRDLFIECGGHRIAAGFTIKNENIEKLKKALIEEGQLIPDEYLQPNLIIDAEIGGEEIDEKFLDFFYRFEPYGRDNPEPVFLMKDVIVVDSRLVGSNGNHIKFSIQKDKKIFNVISFNNAEKLKFLTPNKKADILFRLFINEWQGQKYLELELIDLKEK
ncbi:MAG: single-stranded-DNA-specific exonuclease RecJ [Patescibacteria group bacterium]|jgi:single-stranded-DNA-specific exonuclease|nr:single-stranded-DNA-specific exonuclease RecJ [Patescibacteria group bacterium]